MKKDMFDIIFKFLAIAALGANAVGFVSNKTDAAKYDDKPLTAEVATHTTDIAVLKTQYTTLEKKLDENSKDVKLILQTLRPDDFKPAVLDKRVPLVKGVADNGEPINEKEN